MTALTANLSIDGTIASLDGPLKVGQFYHLEDEVVQCTGSVTLNYADVTQGNRWRLSRGEDSTIAAAHISGTALTLAREYESGGAGGGAIILDNEVDPPEEVTTIIAPGATISGGTAQLLYVQEADPGAIGANTLWVRKIAGGLGFHQLLIRNEADDGWLGLAPVILQAGADATTMLASVDNEVNMFLAIAGEESSQIHGNRTTFSGSSGKINNIALADVPATHAQIAVSTTDPSAAAGQARTLGSIWIRQNGTAGELWIKTGAADTEWTKLTP